MTSSNAPSLIGLTGPARSGKDTVASFLLQDSSWRSVSFAGPLKDALIAMRILSPYQCDGPQKEQPVHWLGKSPRQLMQSLGTEWGRQLVHEHLWTLLAQETILQYMAQGFNVVVTDIRFENEAMMVRSNGGRVWHVSRQSAQKVVAHVSESGVHYIPSDLKIANDSSLADLQEAVAEALEAA